MVGKSKLRARKKAREKWVKGQPDYIILTKEAHSVWSTGFNMGWNARKRVKE